jgi:hypothetical protein
MSSLKNGSNKSSSSTSQHKRSAAKDDANKSTKTNETTSTETSNKTRGSSSSTIDEEKLETGRRLIKEFKKTKLRTVIIYVILLFSISLVYSFVLYYTLDRYIDNVLVAQIFILFALVCCSLISMNQYVDMKHDIDTALKDLSIMLK